MKQKLLLISFVLCLVLMGFATSNVTASSGIAAYYVGPGESYKVTLNGAERFITNKTASTIFIPARTLAEQQSFINNAPSGVAVNYFIACPSNNTFTDSRDGNVYPTVQIGSQCWMAKNLAYLPSVVDSETDSETTPYYYVYGYNGTNVYDAKATPNYTTHGVLYNQPAALSACPFGWKLPSDEDFKVLEMYLGMTQAQADEISWRGTDEGSKLSTLTLNGDNSSGFTALLSGYRHFQGGFYLVDIQGHYWCGPADPWAAPRRMVHADNSAVYRSNVVTGTGLSVRCLKE